MKLRPSPITHEVRTMMLSSTVTTCFSPSSFETPYTFIGAVSIGLLVFALLGPVEHVVGGDVDEAGSGPSRRQGNVASTVRIDRRGKSRFALAPVYVRHRREMDHDVDIFDQRVDRHRISDVELIVT